MKKEVIIGLTTVLLVATPAFAAPGNGNSNSAKENHGQEVKAEKTQNIPPVNLPTNVPVTIPPISLPNVEQDEVVSDAIVSTTPSPTPTKHGNGLGQLKKVLGASVSPSPKECDPNAAWKNHGAYVSCVAKTHPGGAVVAEAARSDIGKKDHHPSITPTGSPSATPTVSPTPPISSPEMILGVSTDPIDTFFKALGRFFHSLPFFGNHGHNK